MARADRRRDARARPAAPSRQYESAYVGTEGLFFQRLRTHAKWAFVFLAVVFGVGFVAFGVGSDVQGGLADLFQGRTTTGGTSVGDARDAVQDDPKDPEAWRELSTALQQDGQTEEAVAPLQKYLELRPRDEDALRELAGLQLARANQLRDEAIIAQAAALEVTPQTDFLPAETTELGRALGQQPITDDVADRANQAFTRAYQRMQAAYNGAKGTYVRLARLAPDDASIQFQLADTATTAGDNATAIAAYKRFLKLAPDDPSAPAVRQQLKELQQQPATSVSTASGG